MSKTPNKPIEHETRGYIIDEDNDFALKDISRAMNALALVFDESEHDVIEINGGDIASIFRVFSRSTKSIYDQADFANSAMVRARHLN